MKAGFTSPTYCFYSAKKNYEKPEKKKEKQKTCLNPATDVICSQMVCVSQVLL
jgi:hypothetical protein